MESVGSSLSSLNDNDQMVIFVKVNGLRSQPSALSNYLQIQISTSHTFGDVLYLLLEEHKASETLTELDILNIRRLSVKVQHQSKSDGVQIDANIGASCIGLKLAGNHFVQYEFQEATRPQKEPINPFNLLMAAYIT